MAFQCSIGIVTYLGRFDEHFKPLIRRLSFLFPDYDINVFINGHYDIDRQCKYLGEVTTFLSKYPCIRYVTNVEHQALTRGWNWLVIMAKHEYVLILNDDISLRPVFRYQLEHISEPPGVFTINGSWSHFVISKSIIRRIGWFDERFLGVGDEDGDYLFRLTIENIPICNKHMIGLYNLNAKQNNPGWKNFSSAVDDKYAQYNRDFFMKKWYHSAFEEVPENGSFVLEYFGEKYRIAPKKSNEEMPQFYPLSVLDSTLEDSQKSILSFFLKILAFIDYQFHLLKKALKRLIYSMNF
ncbi:MAG: hypothetical protein JRJ85_05625 [Deltaproteobacteria bacterium]|nr:hypothetical protein [Deltaproteobacteria bacterium]